MTVVDTSAVIAAAEGEPDAGRVVEALASPQPVRMSAATWVELWIVVDSRRDATLSNDVEELLSGVEIEPVTAEQAALARRAYQQYGKGQSPARLNYGDCFSYALAKASGEPLVFVGGDFALTDLGPLPPSRR